MPAALHPLLAVEQAGLADVNVQNGAIWVYGCDYLIAATPTRRGHFWEVTNMDAQEEIGGRFPNARAAVDFALGQGRLA